MGTADRLLDDAVDHPEPEKIGRGQPKDVGGIGRTAAVLPENGGAALGRDDRVAAEFQHQDAVCQAEGQRATRPALAGHRRDDGHADAREYGQRRADGLALSAFFCADAGIGAWRIDEVEDGQLEAVGHLEEADRFAVPLGVRHPEVSRDVFAGGAALLVTDDHHAAAAVLGDTADDGRVVGEPAIAVELDELGAEARHVVERVGPLGVAGDLHLLHGRQRAEDLASDLVGLMLEAAQLVLETGLGRREDTQLAHSLEELDDGGLEGQDEGGHGSFVRSTRDH